MTHLRLLFGHLHPFFVHFPIGIFFLLAIFELSTALSRRGRLAWLPSLSGSQRGLFLFCAAGAAALTAAMGWTLAAGGDYDAAAVHRHRIFGVSVAALGALLLVFHLLKWRRAGTGALVAVLLALIAAGQTGSGITRGSDFLVQCLPMRFQRLLGERTPAAATTAVSPAADAAKAPAFALVVQPILTARCVGCHGPEKSKNGFRCDSYAALLKGGDHGAEIRPGQLERSEFVRRIELPLEEKEHMPPTGKRQLADDERTLLEWWIDAGADKDKTIAELEQPPDVERILSSRFEIEPAKAVPNRTTTLAAAAQLSASLGVIIRPLTLDGPWISVNARVLHSQFGDGQLAQLSPIAASVYWIDFGGTAVTDRGLEALSTMKNLRRLDLSRTAVTDSGLAQLRPLGRLEYLNLYGTAVTDAGLPSLVPLARLRSLYLWQTRVTPAAAAAFAARHTDRRRIRRLQGQLSALQDEIRGERFDYNLGSSLPSPSLASKPASKATPMPKPAATIPSIAP